MSLPRLAVRRPVTMSMISGVVVLLGAVALFRLPVDLMPDVTFPSLTVTVSYPTSVHSKWRNWSRGRWSSPWRRSRASRR